MRDDTRTLRLVPAFKERTVRRIVRVGLALAGLLALVEFAPAVYPLFAAFDIGGLYHLGFLLVAMGVLAAPGRRLYPSYKPVTDSLTRHVVEATGRDTDHMSTEP